MIGAFFAAFRELKDPKIMGLVMTCVGLTLAVYIGLFALLVWALRTFDWGVLPWVETLMDLSSGVAAGVIAWLLFPGVVSGLMGLYLERVIAAVETAHYPNLGAARPAPVMESVGAALKLIGLSVGLNLILLPIYVVLVFLPPLNLLLFTAVNGRLLGTEYFNTVALRRMDGSAAAALLQTNKWRIAGAGALTTALLTIPVLNLAAPVIGTVAMVHIFHKLTGRA
jgi:uncharacterized protein involved in cysteine biosynthesis